MTVFDANSVFPLRSTGVLKASLRDRCIVYDLVEEARHQLNASAGEVFELCDGVTSCTSTIQQWAEQAGSDADLIGTQVEAVLGQFRALGLVERRTEWQAPAPRTGQERLNTASNHVGEAHLVLDRTIRFQGSDAQLIDEIDGYLGTGVDRPSPDSLSGQQVSEFLTLFEVRRGPEGSVELRTDEVVDHDTTGTLLRRLVMETTDYAAASHGCTVLHAGGVRSVGGELVVLPSVSDGGKSTLTGAFVAKGWDYLSDEAIGVSAGGVAFGFPKRFRLDPVSRSLLGVPQYPDQNVAPTEIRSDVKRLGGRVGRVDLLVFPEYRREAELQVESIDETGSLDALLANTLNLARVGQPGLEALCELAESTPAYRLIHGNAFEAVAAIESLLKHGEQKPDGSVSRR